MNIDEARQALSAEIIKRQQLELENEKLKSYLKRAITDLKKLEIEKLISNTADDGTTIKSCPFCNCELSKFPEIMTVHKEYDDSFIKYMHDNGNFTGSNDYRVYCQRCGARGSASPIKEKAIKL